MTLQMLQMVARICTESMMHTLPGHREIGLIEWCMHYFAQPRGFGYPGVDEWIKAQPDGWVS